MATVHVINRMAHLAPVLAGRRKLLGHYGIVDPPERLLVRPVIRPAAP